MARRRPPTPPDPERTALLEDADTIEALAGYGLRAADPPLPEFVSGWPTAGPEQVCDRHPDHPAVVAFRGHQATADEMRAEAANG